MSSSHPRNIVLQITGRYYNTRIVRVDKSSSEEFYIEYEYHIAKWETYFYTKYDTGQQTKFFNDFGQALTIAEKVHRSINEIGE